MDMGLIVPLFKNPVSSTKTADVKEVMTEYSAVQAIRVTQCSVTDYISTDMYVILVQIIISGHILRKIDTSHKYYIKDYLDKNGYDVSK